MADGFDRFDGRYDLDRYDAIEAKRKSGPTNWFAMPENQGKNLSEPEWYRIEALPNADGRVVRLSTRMYERVFTGNNKSDVIYTTRPCRVIIKATNRKWWKPSTWKKVLHVNAVSGWARGKFEDGNSETKYAATVGVSDKIAHYFKNRKSTDDLVHLTVVSKHTPLWKILLARHPSDSWNLSIIFLYWSTLIALVFNLIGEGYEWPKLFRQNMDLLWHWLITRH